MDYTLHHIEPQSKFRTYLPLIIVLVVIIGITALLGWLSGDFSWQQLMRYFMGVFFILFGAFKLMDWTGFADAFAGYDIVANHSRLYAYVYPLIELILGAAFLFNVYPLAASLATVIVMAASSVGVVQQLMKHRQIQCACLGTVIRLPMSTITVIEDVGMGIMAVFMIVMKV
jgi:hypothetical protein